MTYAARELRRRSTGSERQLWEQIRDRRFRGLKFRRQHPIGTFVVDFYCSELKLAIEIDGPIHLAQVRRDGERQQALEAEGITVVRVTVDQVAGDVVAVLEELIPLHRSETPRRIGGEGQG